MKKIGHLSLLIVFLMFGCATQTVRVADLFRPSEVVAVNLPKFDGLPHGEIYHFRTQKELSEFIAKVSKLGDSSDLFLGWMSGEGDEAFTPGAARNFTAECGGDKYIAAITESSNGYINFLWVRASPARQRELLKLGAIKFALPSPLNPAGRKPDDVDNLLLSDSIL
jgi:hypothetical protein